MTNGEVLAQTQAGASRHQQAPTSYSCPMAKAASVRALTNSSRAITDTFRYDAFGNLLSHTGTSSAPYGYDSQRYDAASGLYALRARSYDPTTGRFLSRDPATGNTTDPAQLDRYVYAAANPIMQSDPSGLFAFDEEALAAAEVVDPAASVTSGAIGEFYFATATYFHYGTLSDVGVPLVALDALVDGTTAGLWIYAAYKGADQILQALASYSGLLQSPTGSSVPAPSPSPTMGTPTKSGGASGHSFVADSNIYMDRVDGGIAQRERQV